MSSGGVDRAGNSGRGAGQGSALIALVCAAARELAGWAHRRRPLRTGNAWSSGSGGSDTVVDFRTGSTIGAVLRVRCDAQESVRHGEQLQSVRAEALACGAVPSLPRWLSDSATRRLGDSFAFPLGQLPGIPQSGPVSSQDTCPVRTSVQSGPVSCLSARNERGGDAHGTQSLDTCPHWTPVLTQPTGHLSSHTCRLDTAAAPRK